MWKNKGRKATLKEIIEFLLVDQNKIERHVINCSFFKCSNWNKENCTCILK